MKKYVFILAASASFFLPRSGSAQVNEDEIGAWYMYFFTATFSEGPWGVQGDVQYRNWNLGGDLEQLLLRGGATYTPKNVDIKLTLGYGNVTTGAYGPETATTTESRIYQEALFPVRFGSRVHTNHRFRYEQRWVEGQDLRTRYRYNLFVNIPLNKAAMEKHTLYLALYNELFINGQRDIGDGRRVEIFDRNRAYAALGFVLSKKLKVQAGFMDQTTDGLSKKQVQLSVHQEF